MIKLIDKVKFEEFKKIQREIQSERADRDEYYIRTTRNRMLKDFAQQSREWLLEETRDLLEIIKAMKNLENPMLVAYATAIEKRILEIRKNHNRKIISPMISMSKRKSSSTTEAEHYDKIFHLMENTSTIIQEILDYRIKLDSFSAVDEIRGKIECPKEKQDPKVTKNEISKRIVLDGLYS